jgi:hypothetical protein
LNLHGDSLLLVSDDTTTEELGLQRPTNRTDSLEELIWRTVMEVLSILSGLLSSELLTTELGMKEATRT